MWFCVSVNVLLRCIGTRIAPAQLEFVGQAWRLRAHKTSSDDLWLLERKFVIRDKGVNHLSTKENVGRTARLVIPCHSSREKNGCPRLHIRSIQEDSEHNEQSQKKTARL